MHTVHLAREVIGDVKYAAMGIFFSVNDYTDKDIEPWKVDLIDRFFDSMQWETTDSDPKVSEVPFGELMMMVDTDERWAYKGSVTTPPCDTFVYWNILREVYPIKQHHLDLFKGQLKRAGMEDTGNYREI